MLDHDFVGLDRASALQRFLADKAARAGRALRLRIQLRRFDAVCRLVERNVGVGIVPETTARCAQRKTMAIKAVRLTDPWALRDLTICVRDYKALPPYARQLVDHMRRGESGYVRLSSGRSGAARGIQPDPSIASGGSGPPSDPPGCHHRGISTQ